MRTDTKMENDWKLEDAVATLTSYAKLKKDKELHKKALEELKRRAEEMLEITK